MKKPLIIIMVVAVLGILGALAGKAAVSKPSPNPSSSNSQLSGKYKDGTYNGKNADTPYGVVQVSVIISNGKVTDVNFLQMPDGESRSREITAFSEPALKQNTLSAQSAKIDFVSGATSTSYGYQESLQAALDKAAGSAFVSIQNQNS